MDELQISGKLYISAKRAAKKYGYHADYIGQLARGGKVKAQKVGRSWYVAEDSLATYLGTEAKTETRQEKVPEPIPVPEPEPVLEEPATGELDTFSDEKNIEAPAEKDSEHAVHITRASEDVQTPVEDVFEETAEEEPIRIEKKTIKPSPAPAAKKQGVLLRYLPEEDEELPPRNKKEENRISIKTSRRGEGSEKEEVEAELVVEESMVSSPLRKPVKRVELLSANKIVALAIIAAVALAASIYAGIAIAYSVSFG